MAPEYAPQVCTADLEHLVRGTMVPSWGAGGPLCGVVGVIRVVSLGVLGVLDFVNQCHLPGSVFAEGNKCP